MDIRLIDDASKEDILLKNQAFPLIGRLIPHFDGQTWTYSIHKNDQIDWQTFPDEDYDYDQMKADCQFIGAYDGEHCIGLAILQDDFFRYQYLYDLKVNQDYRQQGVAGLLIAKCLELALAKGYRGVRTIGQDNNLVACLFYLKQGFVIGGLDTHVYTGTPQEGKADVHFYLDGPDAR